MKLEEKIKQCKTFGIISHPDAGKTTLTEKLLLFGGAIKKAGAVKSSKIKEHAHSDWMEIEKQRGISVATSVMAFTYKDKKINILDTPGHKDFAEDTYRTLTAVDSVILVLDSVKGVEIQTEKLMEVCRMRKTPVICFINKMDREGQDPFDLLDEIEQKLNIKVCPLSWPISRGNTFKGVYSLANKKLALYRAGANEIQGDDYLEIKNLEDKELKEHVGEDLANQLIEDVELLLEVYQADKKEVYHDAYLSGEIAPVFFGSAVNNFGVKELLDTFIDIAPPPQPRDTSVGLIDPKDNNFTGFVFKIHANMDPKHRNRIAFLRVCSGNFARGKTYMHQRAQKKIRLSNVTAFMAQEREIIEEAYPGDIVGIYDTGNLKIGDTLYEKQEVVYKGIPSFSPEIFKEVINTDTLRTKQLEKGLKQLMEEGVAQLFKFIIGNKKIVGTVGSLQFEVIQHRLKHEYNASCKFVSANYYKACWISSEDKKRLEEFMKDKKGHIALDSNELPVFIAPSKAWLSMIQENAEGINFSFKSDF